MNKLFEEIKVKVLAGKNLDSILYKIIELILYEKNFELNERINYELMTFLIENEDKVNISPGNFKMLLENFFSESLVTKIFFEKNMHLFLKLREKYDLRQNFCKDSYIESLVEYLCKNKHVKDRLNYYFKIVQPGEISLLNPRLLNLVFYDIVFENLTPNEIENIFKYINKQLKKYKLFLSNIKNLSKIFFSKSNFFSGTKNSYSVLVQITLDYFIMNLNNFKNLDKILEYDLFKKIYVQTYEKKYLMAFIISLLFTFLIKKERKYFYKLVKNILKLNEETTDNNIFKNIKEKNYLGYHQSFYTKYMVDFFINKKYEEIKDDIDTIIDVFYTIGVNQK